MHKKVINKKCKKYVFLFIFFINIFILFFSSFSLNFIYAKGDNSADISQEQINESVLDILDGLDLRALEEYLDSIDFSQGEPIKQRLLSLLENEAFDTQAFGDKIMKTLFEKIISILPAFTCIAAVTLLSGIISSLRVGSTAHTSADMIFLITYAAALLPLICILIECFTNTKACIEGMKTQMQLVFPIMLTLIAASGGTSTVAVCKPTVAFFTGTIVNLISSIVLPITVTIIVLSMASNLSKELKISKFSAFFKSINKWIIGISISVFGLFLTLQGLTAATHDGIVRRAAKYAIGNGVPIVGGFLSGGFDLAIAGSVLIKNALGTLSIFLMISILFEPLVLLISVNVLLRFTAAITQPFGESRISDFLGETADNLHYCSAGLLFTAFMYFLSIVIMVTATEGLF